MQKITIGRVIKALKIFGISLFKVIVGLTIILTIVFAAWVLSLLHGPVEQTFQVRKECMLADANQVEIPFDPVRYRMRVKGELSGNARIYLTIRSEGSPEMIGQWINLKAGKIDTLDGGDLYERVFTVIYVPETPVKTRGHLTIKVEIH